MAKKLLTDDEIERYARHIVLREVGGAGQARLKAAQVLVVGAGGLGSPVILYLAAAGVGTIGIADFDTVALSNLQRQIAHRNEDVGRPKADSAAERARAINPDVNVVIHNERIEAANVEQRDRRLRHRGRRLGQFRHAISAERRLLLRGEDAGLGRRHRIRRPARDLQGASGAARHIPIPATAACSRSRRRRAPRPIAARRACWAPPRA